MRYVYYPSKSDVHRPASAIGNICDNFIQQLKDATGCGGLMCVAGPQPDGKPFFWMYVAHAIYLNAQTGGDTFHRRSEGTDRDGHSLLDFVLQAANISPVEFKALATVWIERTRAGE